MFVQFLARSIYEYIHVSDLRHNPITNAIFSSLQDDSMQNNTWRAQNMSVGK